MAPTTSTAPKLSRHARKFFAKEFATAKQNTEPILRRPAQKSIPLAFPARGTVPIADLVARLQASLREERKEILEPLLHRLQTLGRNFADGRAIPLQSIEDGLGLWEGYLDRLHDLHITQIRLAGRSEEHEDRCALPLIELEGDPARGKYRLQVIRGVWNGHNYPVAQYRGLLGLVLLRIDFVG